MLYAIRKWWCQYRRHKLETITWRMDGLQTKAIRRCPRCRIMWEERYCQ